MNVWNVTKWIYAVGGAVWLALYVQSQATVAMVMALCMIAVAAVIEGVQGVNKGRDVTRSREDQQ